MRKYIKLGLALCVTAMVTGCGARVHVLPLQAGVIAGTDIGLSAEIVSAKGETIAAANGGVAFNNVVDFFKDMFTSESDQTNSQ